VATTIDSPPLGQPCASCGGTLAADQRYCLNCGTANAAASAPDVRDLLAPPEQERVAPTAALARPAASRISLLPGWDVSLTLAVAVFAFVLGIGAWAGARTTSGGTPAAPIAIAAAPAPVAAIAHSSAPSTTTTDTTGSAATDVTSVPATDTAATPVDSTTSAGSGSGGTGGGGDSTSSTGDGSSGSGTTQPSSGDGTNDTATTPPLKHVWVISLADQGYDTLFDPAGGAPYLAKDLAAKGTVLSHYNGVTTGGMADGVALVSGQGPNAATQAGCPSVSDVTPGTVGADDQSEGTGCLYSTDVFSIADLLAVRKLTWHAYAGALDSAGACPKPVAGAAFPAPRVPFLAFHTIIDDASCADRVTGLAPLAGDLASAKTTPAFSYIVPGPCEDGSATPCTPGTAAGLPPANAFLKRIVPPILASPAYADAGAIVILADEAPQGADGADTSACCAKRPWQGSTLATAGGGRTGALVLSPLAGAGAFVNTPVDHYDLLKTMALGLGLRPPGYAGRKEVSGLPKKTWARWKPPGQG